MASLRAIDSNANGVRVLRIYEGNKYRAFERARRRVARVSSRVESRHWNAPWRPSKRTTTRRRNERVWKAPGRSANDRSHASQASRAPATGADSEDDSWWAFGVGEDVARPLRALLLSQLVLFLGVGALLPALPLYAQSIGLSPSSNGLVISAPALAMLALNAPFGRATDRFGRKPMMIGGMVIMAIADVATGMSRSIVALVPARVLLGVGRAGSECGDRAFLADLCARVPEKRGIIVASQSTVHAVGLVFGPLLGGGLMETYGAPAAFYGVAVAALGTGLGYTFLPETLREETRLAAELKASLDDADGGLLETPKEPLNPFTVETSSRKNARKDSSWFALLKDVDQRLLLLCASANSLGFVAKLTVIPLFASSHLNASPAEVGQLFSITALLGLVTAPFAGLAADKFGKKLVIGAALATASAGLFFGANAESQSQLMFCIGAWGMGTSAAGPAINALAQELAPEGGEGEALTLPKSAADLVFLIGPLALGIVDDAIGTDNAGMFLTSIVAATAAVSCVFLPVPSKSEPT